MDGQRLLVRRDQDRRRHGRAWGEQGERKTGNGDRERQKRLRKTEETEWGGWDEKQERWGTQGETEGDRKTGG